MVHRVASKALHGKVHAGYFMGKTLHNIKRKKDALTAFAIYPSLVRIINLSK